MTVEPQTFYARMYQRQDTAANWTAENPILAPGEFGIEYDPATPGAIALKLGRGVVWSTTPYIQISEALPTDLGYGYSPAGLLIVTSSTGADVTLPVATTTQAGLLPPRTGVAGTFLSVGGGWAVPPGVCDLGYDAASRLLSSSTGQDVTLPLVGTVVGGAPVAGLQTAAEAARLAESGSPTFAGLTVAANGIAYLPHIHGALAGSLYQHIRNDTGASLAVLTPYRVTDSQGATDRVLIVAARADTAALMPASGITSETLAVNGDGHGVVAGEILGVNTAGLTAGAPLYVGSAGGLTSTAPAIRAQMVAVVGRVHATTGSILVQVGTVKPTAAEVGADSSGTAATAVASHAAAAGAHTAAQVGADPAGTAAEAVAGHAGGIGVHSIAGVSGLPQALDAKAPLTLTVIQVAYSATVNIDFQTYTGTIVNVGTLTGNLQITFSNIAAGRTCAVALTCDSTQRTLTFPAAAPFFGTKPATIAASKQMRLTFECIGATEATVHCAAVAQA